MVVDVPGQEAGDYTAVLRRAFLEATLQRGRAVFLPMLVQILDECLA